MSHWVHPSFGGSPKLFPVLTAPLSHAERALEVLFSSEKIKRQLCDHRELQKRWGTDGAKKISLRLQQLSAATSLADLRGLPGRCHELDQDHHHSLAIGLHHPFRLILRPTGDPPLSKTGGDLDWSAVDSVTVTEILDYR